MEFINNKNVRLLAIVLLVLASLSGLLHLVSVLVSYYFSNSFFIHAAPFFDLDNERNIPTVYTALLLGCCAFMCLITLQTAKAFTEKVIWVLAGIFYFLMAFDEFLGIHEALALPIRNYLSISNESIFFHAWVIPALSVTFLAGLVTLVLFIRQKISQHQKSIIMLTVLLAGVVIALEAIGTKLYFSMAAYKLGPVMLEEMTEISLISLILFKLTQKLAKHEKTIKANIN